MGKKEEHSISIDWPEDDASRNAALRASKSQYKK